MNTADWDASALSTWQRAERMLFRPASLAWFAALWRQVGGADPLSDFEAWLRAVMPEGSPGTNKEAPPPRPASPIWASTAVPSVRAAPIDKRRTEPVEASTPLVLGPSTSNSRQALSAGSDAPVARRRRLALTERSPAGAGPTTGSGRTGMAAASAPKAGLGVEAAVRRSPPFLGTQRAQRKTEDTEKFDLEEVQMPLRPPRSSAPSASKKPPAETFITTAKTPQANEAPQATTPTPRVIAWPGRPAVQQQAATSRTEPTHEAGRTRVVDGIPALKGLMQAALADSQARHGIAAMPAAIAPPAQARPDPIAEDALIDRVIDRLDERLREQSLRHLGFTGGLTP